jgi:hypothetical protein
MVLQHVQNSAVTMRDVTPGLAHFEFGAGC